jgi:DNA-binding transcriptional regulator YiaG
MTPAKVLRTIRREFSGYIFRESKKKNSENWFETDLHKEISARMTPGKYLRNLREASGMTQKELGEKIGVSANYVSDWENGQRNISRFAAKKLSRLFNVNPGIFI